MTFNLRQIASKLSTRGWIAVGAAAVVGVVFIYALMTLASAPSYTTLVAGVSPAQAQKITTALAADGIQNQLSNSGTAVSVQSSQAGQARDLLDANGLLVDGGSQSLQSLLGNQPLGASDEEQQEYATSAMEQQLDQTIEGMNGINSADVMLAIPDETDNLFNGTNTQPSASVLLTTSGSLQSSAVKAIAQSVANSVPGLNIDKVTITDQDGDPLWPTSGNGSGDGLTAKQSAEVAYDTQEANAADAMLASTIGPGKGYVEVNADLNMNTQTVSSVSYGTKTVPLTSTTTTQKLTGNPNAASAAGNTATNIAADAGTSTTGTTKYSDKSNQADNGVDKTVSQSTVVPGAVNRQTVAVVVNSSVPATDDAQIESAVESAVGYKTGRDQITMSTLPFAKVKPVAVSSTGKDLGDLKYVGIVLGSLLFLLLITRMLRRRESDEFAGRPTWLRELELPRPLAELEAQTQMVDLDPPTVVARLRSPVNLARQQIEELVDRDPERVAAQLRQWMTED